MSEKFVEGVANSYAEVEKNLQLAHELAVVAGLPEVDVTAVTGLASEIIERVVTTLKSQGAQDLPNRQNVVNSIKDSVYEICANVGGAITAVEAARKQAEAGQQEAVFDDSVLSNN